jgi:SAM-dependent methyltransferase
MPALARAIVQHGNLLDATLYDRRLGVETSAAIALPSRDGNDLPYLPTRWWVLPGLLALLDLEGDDVLLDAGCGKGRIVLQAAREYELKRVIGLDVQPQLIARARENVAALRGPRSPVELLLADAATWTVPDDLTAICLQNPFRGAVLDGFLDQVLASYDRCPRRLRLLYVYPWNRSQVEARPRFKLSWSREGPVRKVPARLYAVV